MKRMFSLLVITLIVAALTASAQTRVCQNVGGVLMTNIALMPYGPEGATNLGPAFGDLAGSIVATEIKTSPITFQGSMISGSLEGWIPTRPHSSGDHTPFRASLKPEKWMKV